MTESTGSARRWRAAILLAAFALAAGMGQRPAASQSGGRAPFVPTTAPADARYVGAKTCALCHDEKARSYPENAMARALEPIADCQVLRERPKLAFKQGRYAYAVERQGAESYYTVTDGEQTIREPIAWAFGRSKMGQTYVIRHKGQLYESRVSYYNAIDGLDLTLGAPSTATPRTLEEALGRLMQSADTKDCFGCHAQAAVGPAGLQLEKLTPGVTCESCHGPGADHVALAKTGGLKEARDKRIYNPGRLSPYDLSQQFCGACHRSWEQIQLIGLRGIGNVRFQPYRLTYSPCYDPDDKRISCNACHDVHQPMQADAAGYDAKCLACHQQAGQKPRAEARGRACKVGAKKCASCHMPEYEIPGSHFRFTDHMIRVVKPNEPYPN